jgi:hypothetical protein
MVPIAEPVAPPGFDARLHISPVALLRRLAEGQVTGILEVRGSTSKVSLRGAIPWDGRPPLPLLVAPGGPIRGGEDALIVLIDLDGQRASELARDLGHPQVRALYGGMTLYLYSLDPSVVGEERFLADSADDPPPRPGSPLC